MIILKKHEFIVNKEPKQLASALAKRIQDTPMAAIKKDANGLGWLGGVDEEGFGFQVIKRDRVMPLPKIRAAITPTEKGARVYMEARPSPFAIFYLLGFIVFGAFMAFNSQMGSTALMIPILPVIVTFFAHEALQKSISETFDEIERLITN